MNIIKQKKTKIAFVAIVVLITLLIVFSTLSNSGEKKIHFSTTDASTPYQINLYNSQSNVLYNPHQGWILHSNSPNDHLATPFLDIGGAFYQKQSIAVELRFPSGTPAEHRPMVYLQCQGVSAPITLPVIAYADDSIKDSFILQTAQFLSPPPLRLVMSTKVGRDIVLPNQVIITSSTSLPTPFDISLFISNFKMTPQGIAKILFVSVLLITGLAFFIYNKKQPPAVFSSNSQIASGSEAFFCHIPYLFVIICVTSISMIIFPSFVDLGRIDPILYLSYSLHFTEYYGELFKNTYYGTRLALTLPGYLLHSILSPLQAHLVLVWLKLAIGAFSLYASIVRFRGPASSMLIAVLFCLCPWVIISVSSLYIEGYGIVFYLLTAALIIQAVYSPCPQKWLVAGGVSAAMLFSTNIFYIVYCIPLFLFYLLDGRAKNFRHNIHSLAFYVTWMGVGFITLLCLFGLCSIHFGGDFLFFSPSFNVISNFIDIAHGRDDLSWLKTSKHLDIHFFTALIAALTLFLWVCKNRKEKKRWDFSHTAALVFILTFCLSSLHGNPLSTLYLPQYSRCLLGVSFLVLGSYIRLEKRHCFMAACFTGLAAIGAHYGLFQNFFNSEIAIFLGFSWFALLCTFLVAYYLVRFPQKLGIWLMTAWLCWVGFYSGHYILPNSEQLRQSKADFKNLITAHEYIWSHADNRTVRFWYKYGEAPEYDSLASFYLYMYRLHGTSFPDMQSHGKTTNEAVTKLPSNTDLVILSKRSDVVNLVQNIFAKDNQTAILKHQKTVDGHNGPYTIFIFRILCSSEKR